MGILSRLTDIMRVNVDSILQRNNDPEKTIDEYMRTLNSDLRKVKAETASVLAEEQRAKAQLDECSSEIKKLQRYAEKSVESGNEEGALKFLERKAQLGERLTELQAAYELASNHAASMKQMQDKLVADLGQLEARRVELKGKLAAAKLQQEANSGRSSSGDVQASFRAMEERADQALNEAEALAELRAGAKEDDLDAQLAQLEKHSGAQQGEKG
ncbi:PspA/IM30 family protein [Paenibacillus sp. OAS669]|uniref:PspA/IM30 family protein n=1 Tax=Paenibacillus sp. OAS669 TaxID=2663821 RepID=UPI00178B1B2B|nr:PspA/IM30 family protein [Paenibacillus sp. OAS669]MBE1443005.1 phage shock protein A [Paenibacillus sp. OAS669]